MQVRLLFEIDDKVARRADAALTWRENAKEPRAAAPVSKGTYRQSLII